MAKRRFKLFPDPQEGSGLQYGPTPKQQLLFIEDLPDPEPGMTEDELKWCRPHVHPLDVVLFIGAARCYGEDSEFLMLNGSVKKIQELVIGDFLIGPDDYPREVTELSSGDDFMFSVQDLSGKELFTCNSQHVLKLRDKNGKFYDIPARQYFNYSEAEQKKLFAWRPEYLCFNGHPIDIPKEDQRYRIKLVYKGEGKYYSFKVSGNDDSVLLADGTVASNSGKSISAAARTLDFMLRYPGTVGIVGAENLKLLERTAVEEIKGRFTTYDEWDHLEEPNPLIRNKIKLPYKQQLKFSNRSLLHFLHFSQPGKLKGINASFVWYEEADQMPHSGAFEELHARMANNASDLRQMILTTNPVKARKGWLKMVFKLEQFDPHFKGEKKPIVDPCCCQYCPKCVIKELGNWEFHDENGNPSISKGSICSNPNCANIAITDYHDGKGGIALRKDNNCPGGQCFYRVIETSSDDNPHKAADYELSASAGMSKKVSRAMIGGMIEQDHEGEVYLAFSDENINYDEVSISYDKDIIWANDQDEDPHYSCICQETEDDHNIRVDVIDEIFEWDFLPWEAAKEFSRRYHKLKFTENYVRVYCDPSGLYMESKKKLNYYQTIIQYLQSPTDENGDITLDSNGEPDFSRGKAFKVRVMQKKEKSSYDKKLRAKQITVDKKVQCSNMMYCNTVGERRVFVNKRCRRLIQSVQGVKWIPGQNKINKSVDKIAKENQEVEMIMTHPSDALGYYLALKFPLVKDKSGILLIGSERSTTIYKDGKVYNKTLEKIREETLKEREERRKKDLEEKRRTTPNVKPRNAREFMRMSGLKLNKFW